MIVEATLYMLAAVLPEAYIPAIGPKQEPLFRYISWLLCCPILIKVLLKMLSAEGKVNPNNINILILLDIFMTCMGIFACMYSDRTVQMGFFCVGFAAACIMVYKISKIFAENRHLLANALERQVYMIFFFSMWAVFAFLFLLGPPMYALIPDGAMVICHVISDLLAKNTFCMMSWKLNRLPPRGEKVMDGSSGLTEDVETGKEVNVHGNTSSKTLDIDSLKQAMKEVMETRSESTTHNGAILTPEFSVRGLMSSSRSLPSSQHNTPSQTYRNIPVGLQGTPQGSPMAMNRTLGGGSPNMSQRQLRTLTPGDFPGTPTGQTRSLQQQPVQQPMYANEQQMEMDAQTMLMQQLAEHNNMLINPPPRDMTPPMQTNKGNNNGNNNGYATDQQQQANNNGYATDQQQQAINNGSYGPVADRVQTNRSRSRSREPARDSPPRSQGRSIRDEDSSDGKRKSKKKRSDKKRKSSSNRNNRRRSRERRNRDEGRNDSNRYEGGRTADDYE